MIYTSGSTGEPKGVAIEHHSAVEMLRWAGSEYKEELGSVLASTSVCFDLSIYEIFGPLSVGGQVVLVGSLMELMEQEQSEEVRVINTVPSAMRELLRMKKVPGGVKVVNLAGEVLDNKLAQEVYERGVEKVVNLYGPSEDTTYTTWEEVRRGSGSEPSIGRPIRNTKVYVLDEQMKMVPIGVRGELYIGGEGLARVLQQARRK